MTNNQKFGISLNTCDPLRIIDNLENQSYPNTNFNGLLSIDNMRIKIEDFTDWLNSTFRINILHENIDKEIYLYLLLNLKKNLRLAIKEINKTTQNRKYKFKCNKCDKTVSIDNNRNFWECLQDHEHCEEILIDGCDNNDIEMTNELKNDKKIHPVNNNDNNNYENVKTINNDKPPGLNDFRFNFVVKYDPLIEYNYYPETLMTMARSLDKSIEYSIQRSGVNRAVCLLCPCQITTKAKKNNKVSQFLLKSHISGHKHLKSATNNHKLLNLKNYHDFWRIQDLQYQSHQVYFQPKTDSIKCYLCNENLVYDNVIEHVKNEEHKTNFIKWITSDEGQDSRLYLIEIQMSVYCKNYNINGHTPVATTPSPPPPPLATTVPKTTTTTTLKKPTTPKKVNGNYDKKQHKITNLPPCNVVKSELSFNSDGNICLPDRFQQHEKFFKRTNDGIFCNLCKIYLSYDLKILTTHIRSQIHRQSTDNIKDKNYKYYCEICNAHYRNENGFDHHFNKNNNRHDKIADNRRANLAVYECRTCLLVIYGDEMSISRHRTTTSRANKKKDDVRLSYTVKRLFKSEQLIDEEAKRLTLEANQVLQCKERMRQCCDDLEKALNQSFPNCKAYVFGSRISGTGNINSDLDIFMDIGGMYTGNIKQDPDQQEAIIIKATRVLKTHKNDFKFVLPIPAARTPIIKLQHHFTELDCDISFRHGLGVENTKFLHFCMELQPITQPFILLLKKWSDECKFNEHITNYAFALMAIFYLQLSGYLLPVKVVREFNPHPSRVIDGWETINYTVPVEKMKEFVKPYESNVKQLLQGFFDYFAKFNYANDVVCPLMGKTIPKMSFCEQPEKHLPIEMKTYLRKIQTSDDAEHFRALSPFCIQDPFDLSHNLTKACPNSVVVKFKAYCKASFELLSLNNLE